MSPTGSSPRGPERPPPLLLSDVAQLEEHHGSQQREEEQRDRRALAQVAAVEPDLVRERREEVRHVDGRSEEHTSELQSRPHLVCRLLLDKKNDSLQPA